MSRQLINQYRNRIADLHARTGSLNEGVLSAAFGRLLEDWGRSDDLTLVNQWEGKGPRGNNIRVDGALVPSVLRIPFGYWEAKDGKDNLDKEILSKIASGYPQDNIIYEDTREAILIQNKVQMERVALQGDDEGLLRLLKAFFAYEREEITEFRKAAKQFRADLPQILEALREAIRKAETEKPAYKTSAAEFLSHAKEAINSAVTVEDVREMLIQHILTEEIFTSVFDSATYHRENNVARKLSELESQFFTGDIRHATMRQLSPYYNAIRHAATGIADHLSAAPFFKAKTGAAIGIGEHIRDVQKIFRPVFAFDDLTTDGSDFDRLFRDGERFAIGELEVKVMHVPGHTPADVVYLIGDAAFVGDTLFMPDYGTARADFPGGDARELYRSIRRVLSLPDETRLFLCHDYKAPGRDKFAWESTVGEQRRTSVHVNESISESDFVAMREARDATLAPPKLLLPAIRSTFVQANFPKPRPTESDTCAFQ